MADTNKRAPCIGIFASDKGPGDPERASLMSQTGTLFARRGAHLVCLWENGSGPLPLIAAAQAAGGTVSILAENEAGLPPILAGVPIRLVPDRAERHGLVAQEAQVLVVLPGSLASASALFGSWSAPNGQTRPVVMLNRHRAFEVVRGFAGDVLSHAAPGYDRKIQFADTVEDLWNKVSWVLEKQ